MHPRRLSGGFIAALCLATASLVLASSPQAPSPEPNLTEEQKGDFLLHARVVESRQVGTGITHPWRLTLSDGTLLHDAIFQSVDIREVRHAFADGRSEFDFRDSYHFNIAAYQLAKLLGLGDMVPVTVERDWKGERGALSWWVSWKWMEATRTKENLQPPDVEAWNRQMAKVRVFDELVYDTDANLTNVLITEDWKIWRVDFTRAFRLQHDLKSPGNLDRCDRQLFERLHKLSYDEVLERTKPHLSKELVKALLARRDKMVAHFEKLVSQKGESEVMY
ncbi:MAG: hypothetical protein LAO07_18470 [Acidobacteriia bacterium]|nr:hypothetical protein [Terriglobia bacterium]